VAQAAIRRYQEIARLHQAPGSGVVLDFPIGKDNRAFWSIHKKTTFRQGGWFN
jgi:hypothetical protein